MSEQEKSGIIFRETGELRIEIPALPRPTLEELQEEHPKMGIKSIRRDTSPIGPVSLGLGTVLNPEEFKIKGVEYVLRLAPIRNILFGYQHSVWLLGNYKLPAIRNILDEFRLVLPGLIVIDGNNEYFTPALHKNSRSWAHLDYGLLQFDRLAVAANLQGRLDARKNILAVFDRWEKLAKEMREDNNPLNDNCIAGIRSEVEVTLNGSDIPIL
jgi:hypothetical protein